MSDTFPATRYEVSDSQKTRDIRVILIKPTCLIRQSGELEVTLQIPALGSVRPEI